MNQNTEALLVRTVLATHKAVERMEGELAGVKHGLSILTREVEIMKRRPVMIRMTLGTPVPQHSRPHKL